MTKISSESLKGPPGTALPRGGDAYWFLVTGSSARSAAMPVLFSLSSPKNRFFAQQGRHVAPISPVPNFTFIGAEMWECIQHFCPQNCQYFELWSLIYPSAPTRLHNFYEVLRFYTRPHQAFKFLLWSLSGDNQVISIFPQWGHFPLKYQ